MCICISRDKYTDVQFVLFFAFRPLTDVHYVDGEDDDDGDGEDDDDGDGEDDDDGDGEDDVFLPFPLTEFLLHRHLRAIAGFL